jgi:hypothetical protein
MCCMCEEDFEGKKQKIMAARQIAALLTEK